jgi:hypothetical protein
VSVPLPPRRRAPSGRPQGPTDDEKAELRKMTDTLASHGYDDGEAAELIWQGYLGGMDGARAVFRNLEEIPSVGLREIEI